MNSSRTANENVICVDKLWLNFFKSAFLKVTDRHAPLIQKRVRGVRGSEQQHNQDLKEIYKGRRILEFITFYHNALHLTTLFTTMHCI